MTAMKRFASLFLSLAALVACDVPLVAAEVVAPPKTQGPFAVIVGVSQFDDKAIQPRPSADVDAKAMYDLLADAKYLGIPADRIILLTSVADAKRGSKVATRENIIAAVHQAVAKTGKDDLLLIGLYGRGCPVGIDKFAFFANESTVTDRAKNGVLGEDLATELKEVKSQKLCAFLDIHFKGYDAGKEIIAEPNAFSLFGAIYGTTPEDKDEEEAPVRDKVVVLSNLPGNDPIMKGDGGLFTATVVAGLRGAADVEGYEPDGLICIDELTRYLDKEITTQARILGKTVSEKEAIPIAAGATNSHYAVTHNPAAYPTSLKRLAAFDALAKAGTLPKDAVEEGVKLLSRMPVLKNHQELRKKYQELIDAKLSMEEFLASRAKLAEAMVLPAKDAATFTQVVELAAETLKVKYVKVLNEGDLVAGAIRGLYRRIEEPIPADIEAILKTAKTLDADALKNLLMTARTQLGKREDLDNQKDADIALGMMAESIGDPHTRYFDKETMKREESRLKSQFSGIGIHIRRDLARDGLLVVSPIKGSPAYKAGVKAGDLIVEVRREVDPEGKSLPADAPKVVSMRGIKTDKAIEIILGKPGIPITIVIEREGVKEPIVLDIERGRVSLETVFGVKRAEKDNWDFMLDEENKIGYVYLSQFGPRTAAELHAAMQKLTRQGIKGFVLDLRFNPGGTLPGALLISDMFIESGLLLRVTPRVGKEDKHYDSGEPDLNFNKSKFPMACLVNGGSASASEIVSAVLQDYDRAVVVGERSYGKGSVQTVDPFDTTGGVFKLTTARYFPPLGRNIDKRSTTGKPEDEWGVSPTKGYEVKITREERQDLGELLYDKEHIGKAVTPQKAAKAPFKDRQLDAALDYLKKEIVAKGVGTAKKAG